MDGSTDGPVGGQPEEPAGHGPGTNRSDHPNNHPGSNPATNAGGPGSHRDGTAGGPGAFHHAQPLALAWHWLQIQRPDRALDELSRIHGDLAVTRDAFLIRSAALYEMERYAEACAAAQTGLGQLGPDPALLGVFGSALRALGRYEEAERALLDGLAVDPTDVRLLCLYARLCLDVGQVDKAERLVELAASHDPREEMVIRLRGLVAYARGRDREALAHGREALAADPDDIDNRALFGLFAAGRGDVDGAHRSFRVAAASDPGNAELVEVAREARVAAHPLLVPLRPLSRFGPMQVWIAAVALMFGLRALGQDVLGLAVALVWLVYCVYSWVAPPLVRRLVSHR